MGPLLTRKVLEQLRAAACRGAASLECSLDLQRSTTIVDVGVANWTWQGRAYPYPASCKERTVYHWNGAAFEPVARYAGALVKLVPTSWGPPTFEIDGIKMLPSSKISPYADARHKVDLIEPAGKLVLDTCGGLGYFAAWCMQSRARAVISYEKNPAVFWLRSLNPWSPAPGAGLDLSEADVTQAITTQADRSVDAILHDPPRFGIAGELYSLAFYAQLARVLKHHGKLFHYTGTPNKLSRGRDLSVEVVQRLRRAGFTARPIGDGVLALKSS